MNVLVGCEFTGTVRDAFDRRGHNAWSVDLLPTEKPGQHIQGDLIHVLSNSWDLMIAHPPCTYLCSSGQHWNARRPGRAAETEAALEFVSILMAAPIPKIAIENPIGIISTRIRKPDQIIQPWQFGHDASKATCFWLKGLPRLNATAIVEPRWVCCGAELPPGVGKYGCPNCEGEKVARPRWGNQTNSGQNRLGPSEKRWAERSRTYPGIAEAMAAQWGAGGVANVQMALWEGLAVV